MVVSKNVTYAELQLYKKGLNIEKLMEHTLNKSTSSFGGQGFTRSHCKIKCKNNLYSCRINGYLCNSKSHDSLYAVPTNNLFH